jgi:drug/metabolite transporter (DMT)-like permease
LYIGAAALFWGCSASLGRAAFTGRFAQFGSFQAITPLILSQTRTSLSFLVLFPILLAARGRRKLQLPPVDFGRFLVLAILGVVASNYFYYLAIQRTNVAVAIIVQYTAPVWVLAYMAARRLQKLTWQRATAVLLAVAGVTIAVGVGSGRLELDRLGVLSALVAAFSFAFYNVGGHKLLQRYDHWLVLLYTTFGAALFWLGVNPPWKVWAARYSAVEWVFMATFAMVSVLGPFSLYFAGLKHLEPTRAIVVSCLEPVFSILIAGITLGETIRPLQTLGVLLVLSGIIVIQWPARAEASIPLEPME